MAKKTNSSEFVTTSRKMVSPEYASNASSRRKSHLSMQSIHYEWNNGEKKASLVERLLIERGDGDKNHEAVCVADINS